MDVLLAFVERIAKTSRSMSLGVLILHAVFFTITGAYYVSYPVVGGMVKDLYPEYHLDRKNLMRTMLDTGTAYRKNSHDGNGTAAMVKAVNKIAAITNTSATDSSST